MYKSNYIHNCIKNNKKNIIIYTYIERDNRYLYWVASEVCQTFDIICQTANLHFLSKSALKLRAAVFETYMFFFNFVFVVVFRETLPPEGAYRPCVVLRMFVVGFEARSSCKIVRLGCSMAKQLGQGHIRTQFHILGRYVRSNVYWQILSNYDKY